MSIIKVFNPIKDYISLLHALEYAADIGDRKSVFDDKIVPFNVRAAPFGLPLDTIEATKEIQLVHECYGRPGENLAYKILIDMEGGILTPWQMNYVAWEINEFLRVRNIQYFQGMHCNTRRERNHPHVHIVMNAIYPLTGRMVNVNYDFLRLYKHYANIVLFNLGLPLIKIGCKSIPFKFRSDASGN